MSRYNLPRSDADQAKHLRRTERLERAIRKRQSGLGGLVLRHEMVESTYLDGENEFDAWITVLEVQWGFDTAGSVHMVGTMYYRTDYDFPHPIDTHFITAITIDGAPFESGREAYDRLNFGETENSHTHVTHQAHGAGPVTPGPHTFSVLARYRDDLGARPIEVEMIPALVGTFLPGDSIGTLLIGNPA